jgi:selenide,water dikinase
VGFDTADDAAVYRLSPEIAMINTVDVITPPVDDPYWFGQIAAANSISDIYSMGGKPVTALNVVMFPSKILDMGILREILRGGNDKMVEAGGCLVGGHTVEDKEPKYGLCVNGVVHPDRIVTNAGSRLGDSLILTKPLGTGVLLNAVRDGKFPFSTLEKEVLPTVASLNGPAMEAALQSDLHACTDITGFGIAGHAQEVSSGCGFRVLLRYSSLPFFQGAHEMYRQGVTTSVNFGNRQLTEGKIEIRLPLSDAEKELLYDPQTSGGLLLSIPGKEAEELLSRLHQSGVPSASIVGEVIEGPPGIEVV